MAIVSCYFVCRAEECLVETRLYVWQGFVAKNPAAGHPSGSMQHQPIRTLRASPQLSVRTAPHQATYIILFKH